MSNKPVSREVTSSQVRALRDLFGSRGHTLRKNAKNKYLEFEVRTDGKSIFTLYTSGKFVSTVREGDAEGLVLEDEIGRLAGGPGPTRKKREEVATQEAGADVTVLAGVDETGTGELLGSAVLGGVLFARPLEARLHELVGHVETKTSRAASGWERLGEQLAAMRADGLVATALTIPNRLFDRYSKNALLDLAYVRLVGDLLAAAGDLLAGAGELSTAADGDEDRAGTELAVDDYGTGALLTEAATAWRARGLTVRVQTRADDRFLAARAASVLARATRAREMQGLRADEDEPLGTGNAGHRETLAWLRRRARSGRGWPSFVKTSFKTVTDLERREPVTKHAVPRVGDLLDPDSVGDFLAGRLDVTRARVRTGADRWASRLEVPVTGRHGLPASLEFLPLLCGGVVLDDDLPLDVLDAALDRETGFLSGWRVLLGGGGDPDDPAFLALARAHARGVVHLEPTPHEDPATRAAARAGLRVLADGEVDGLHAVLRV